MPRQKRRSNNEGTIYRRASGSWGAQITLDGRRVNSTHKTQAEAREWIRQTQQQIERGLSYASAHTRLGEYLASWLEIRKSSLSINTHAMYSRIVRLHILPYLENVKLSELTPARIQAAYSRIQEKGASDRMVALVHDVLSVSLKLANRQGLIPTNPAAAVIVPSRHQEEMKIWDDSQVSQFLISIQGQRNEFLYHLALATGMRRGELLGLQWDDIDWQRHTVSISRQVLEPEGGGFVFGPVKTIHGRRNISVGPNIIAKLRQQFEIVNLLRQLARGRWQDNNLVFPSTVGTPQTGDTVTKEFGRLIKASGLPKIRFHDMRHTAASLMLAHGIPVITVSRYLGHSLPSVTLNLYGHLVPGQMEQAAEVMDDITSPTMIEVDL